MCHVARRMFLVVINTWFKKLLMKVFPGNPCRSIWFILCYFDCLILFIYKLNILMLSHLQLLFFLFISRQVILIYKYSEYRLDKYNLLLSSPLFPSCIQQNLLIWFLFFQFPGQLVASKPHDQSKNLLLKRNWKLLKSKYVQSLLYCFSLFY